MVVMIIALVIGLAFYVYMAYSLMVIAKKTNTPNEWMAWIPILNYWLMVQIARQQILWFILFLIPCTSPIALIFVWMKIAEARGKPSWWGFMWLVPIMNIITPGYIAFSD